MSSKTLKLTQTIDKFRSFNFDQSLNTFAAWCLAILWLSPLVYAVWTAFHPSEFETRFDLFAPLTLQNFVQAWTAAPFARYFLNTVILVTGIVAAQFFFMHTCGLCICPLYISGPEYFVYIGAFTAFGNARYLDCTKLSNHAVAWAD